MLWKDKLDELRMVEQDQRLDKLRLNKLRLLLDLRGSSGEAEVPAFDLSVLNEVTELGVADGPD